MSIIERTIPYGSKSLLVHEYDIGGQYQAMALNDRWKVMVIQGKTLPGPSTLYYIKSEGPVTFPLPEVDRPGGTWAALDGNTLHILFSPAMGNFTIPINIGDVHYRRYRLTETGPVFEVGNDWPLLVSNYTSISGLIVVDSQPVFGYFMLNDQGWSLSQFWLDSTGWHKSAAYALPKWGSIGIGSSYKALIQHPGNGMIYAFLSRDSSGQLAVVRTRLVNGGIQLVDAVGNIEGYESTSNMWVHGELPSFNVVGDPWRSCLWLTIAAQPVNCPYGTTWGSFSAVPGLWKFNVDGSWQRWKRCRSIERLTRTGIFVGPIGPWLVYGQQELASDGSKVVKAGRFAEFSEAQPAHFSEHVVEPAWASGWYSVEQFGTTVFLHTQTKLLWLSFAEQLIEKPPVEPPPTAYPPIEPAPVIASPTVPFLFAERETDGVHVEWMQSVWIGHTFKFYRLLLTYKVFGFTRKTALYLSPVWPASLNIGNVSGILSVSAEWDGATVWSNKVTV